MRINLGVGKNPVTRFRLIILYVPSSPNLSIIRGGMTDWLELHDQVDMQVFREDLFVLNKPNGDVIIPVRSCTCFQTYDPTGSTMS